jgi:hypothetical protein
MYFFLLKKWDTALRPDSSITGDSFIVSCFICTPSFYTTSRSEFIRTTLWIAVTTHAVSPAATHPNVDLARCCLISWLNNYIHISY